MGVLLDPIKPKVLDALASRVLTLTPAEIRVLKELLRGGTHHDIGDALDISVRTVETHIKHVMTKLRVNSMVLARLAPQLEARPEVKAYIKGNIVRRRAGRLKRPMLPR